MSIDLTKPIETTDGRPARIICTDMKNRDDSHNIVALVTQPHGPEGIYHYSQDGTSKWLNPVCYLVNVSEEDTN